MSAVCLPMCLMVYVPELSHCGCLPSWQLVHLFAELQLVVMQSTPVECGVNMLDIKHHACKGPCTSYHFHGTAAVWPSGTDCRASSFGKPISLHALCT